MINIRIGGDGKEKNIFFTGKGGLDRCRTSG
jgi:hypothetical protein